jgi:general secretion pathway protein I
MVMAARQNNDVGRAQSLSSSTGEAGFMLLEVVVAFVIAALALGVLYQAAMTGLRATEVASRYEQALSRARSRLVIAGHGSPLVPGDWRGDDGGGFAWRLRAVPIGATSVVPFGIPGLRPQSDFQVTLYAVSVWISWRDGGRERAVRLDTEQIGQALRQGTPG